MSQNKNKNNQLKKQLERILFLERGFVYKLPQKRNVILTMTGGIDSSIGAQLIIEKWGSTIYPFYLKRGATAEKHELKSVRKIIGYLKNKYPKNINDLFVASAPVPLSEIKPNLSKKRIIKRGHPLRNSIIQSYAIQYGVSLNDQGVELDTILVGSVASDYFPGSRDVDLLINTLYSCINLEEWGWQIFSPFLQQGLLEQRLKIKKIDLIKWGHENNFPFGLTRTCTSKDATSCGNCSECKERLETFRKAGVKDPIKYKQL